MEANKDRVRRWAEKSTACDLADAEQIAAIDDLEHAIAPLDRAAPGDR